jgi:hypothetical protein
VPLNCCGCLAQAGAKHKEGHDAGALHGPQWVGIKILLGELKMGQIKTKVK